MTVETLTIEGMHCGHCASLVKKSLEIVAGVSRADVSVGSATVSYDESVTKRRDLEAAVTRFGYRVRDY